MKYSTVPQSFLVLVLLCASTAAKEKQHLPLPQQIISAHTVFIDNQTGLAQLSDEAYREIRHWHRWQIVANADQADVVLLLSAVQYYSGWSAGGSTFCSNVYCKNGPAGLG